MSGAKTESVFVLEQLLGSKIPRVQVPGIPGKVRKVTKLVENQNILFWIEENEKLRRGQDL